MLPRHGSGPHGDWHISLSKPSEKEQHLLMTLVGEQGERGEGHPQEAGGLGGGRWFVWGEGPRRQREAAKPAEVSQGHERKCSQLGLLSVGWAFRIAG